MNFFSDNNEMKWLFDNAMDWESILSLNGKDKDHRKELLESYASLLAVIGKWSSEKVATRARELDKQGAGEIIDGTMKVGPILQKNYDEAQALGLHKLCAPESEGGTAAPFSLIFLSHILINRGCLATSCQLNFFSAFADMIELYCEKEDIERYLPEIYEGKLSGSMALTEPGAGSDLSAISTTATPSSDGQFNLNGTKCFITNAGGGISFVLAKIKGAPPGLAGISMFLVPQYIEVEGKKTLNYRITKNEDKMGIRGSFTCEVVYDNSWGKLLGQANHGLTYMLHLMNQSRIGVSLQTVGGLEACLAYVEKFAKDRKAFGRSLMDLPLYRHNFNSWKTELDAIRALVVDTISSFDIYRSLHLKKMKTGELNKEELKKFEIAKAVMRRRTPLVKYYGSEKYVEISGRCMQALGSYGYMKEYDAERFHRDSLGPIMYEGTSQIQALMVLKDTVKAIAKNPGNFMREMISDHPIKSIGPRRDKWMKQSSSLRYEMNKNFSRLMLRTVSADLGFSPAKLKKLFSVSGLLDESKISALMIHAETITQAQSYIETLEVLSRHADMDASREILCSNYINLIQPRLKAIYETWKQNGSFRS